MVLEGIEGCDLVLSMSCGVTGIAKRNEVAVGIIPWLFPAPGFLTDMVLAVMDLEILF